MSSCEGLKNDKVNSKPNFKILRPEKYLRTVIIIITQCYPNKNSKCMRNLNNDVIKKKQYMYSSFYTF